MALPFLPIQTRFLKYYLFYLIFCITLILNYRVTTSMASAPLQPEMIADKAPLEVSRFLPQNHILLESLNEPKTLSIREPSQFDDSPVPNDLEIKEKSAYFFESVIKKYRGNDDLPQNTAFVMVAHIIRDMVPLCNALKQLGEIACIIPKGSRKGYPFPQAIRESEFNAKINDKITREYLKDEQNCIEFFEGLIKENPNKQFIIIDIGGYFAPCLKVISERYYPHTLRHILEDTLNGQKKYEESLPGERCSVFSVASSSLKSGEDTEVGHLIVKSAQAILEKHQLDIAEMNYIAIIGYGKIGSSIARHVRYLNPNVKVCEHLPEVAMLARAHKFGIVNKKTILKKADVIFCATGHNALTLEDLQELQQNDSKNVYIVSCTSADDEFKELKQFLDPHNPCTPQNFQKVPSDHITTFRIDSKGTTINFLNHGNAANFSLLEETNLEAIAVQGGLIAGVIKFLRAPNHYGEGQLYNLSNKHIRFIAQKWLDTFNILEDNENTLEENVSPQNNKSSCPAELYKQGWRYKNVKEVKDDGDAFKSFTKAATAGHIASMFELGVLYYRGQGVDENKEKALYWFQKAAAQKYAPAQNYLGVMYNKGEGISQDKTEAVKWYTKGANQGHAAAQSNLGGMYSKGEGIPQDKTEAIKWYTKAADQRLAEAQFSLGVMYHTGEGHLQDKTKAVEWFCRAAEQELAQAQCNLGIMYFKGEGVPQDKTEAVKWYTKAAEQGYADAQYNLGCMYDHGKGVIQDSQEAVKWYTKAAKQGNAGAQYILGIMYRKGEGIPQDATQAVEWYSKAAEQGNTDAQCNLGNMYHTGEGIPQDYNEALKWYRKAADQGNSDAQFNLGVMYDLGRSVPKNEAEAMKWYKKAAEQGNADAQFILGIMYFYGLGVQQNITEAVKWFTKAAEKGHNEAINRLSSINNSSVQKLPTNNSLSFDVPMTERLGSKRKPEEELKSSEEHKVIRKDEDNNSE